MTKPPEVQAMIDAAQRPAYWNGCPSTSSTGNCCTRPKGHPSRHSFLGERFRENDDDESDI